MVLFGHYISQGSPEKQNQWGWERERERDVILCIVINI